MAQQTHNTANATPDKNWLSRIGDDRADLGHAIIRLAHLAAAQHRVVAAHELASQPYLATTNGMVEYAAGQPSRVSPHDPSQNTEVLR